MKQTLHVIKIGGAVIDDANQLASFLQQFAAIDAPKIIVHGGGKLATRMADQLGIPQQLLDGRRITDADTLRIVTMVYAGHVNKNIVAALQAQGCNAMGLCGADGNLLLAHKRQHASIDYGFVGDVDWVNIQLIEALLLLNTTLVVAPVTHDGKGSLLNTNADTIAQEIATAMSLSYEVVLVYSFEKNGVLLDATDETTVIPRIHPTYYQELKEKKIVFEGMIPKLENAFAALEQGVSKVIIGKATQLNELMKGTAGTTLEK